MKYNLIFCFFVVVLIITISACSIEGWVKGSKMINCTDTDGGKDYFSQGTVVSGDKVYDDECKTRGKNDLIENYCKDNGRRGKEGISCASLGDYSCVDGACVSVVPEPYCGDGNCDEDETCDTCLEDCPCDNGLICVDGACILIEPEPYCGDELCNGNETCLTCEADCGSCGEEDSCVDSDGGLNYTDWGNVTGYSGGDYYIWKDECQYNGTEVLLERWCNGVFPRFTLYNCSIGNYTSCYYGMCI